MIRGLEIGVRQAVTAKLRERGLSEDGAVQLTDSRLNDAVEIFVKEMRSRQAQGLSLELAIDDAFEELGRWTTQLVV